MLRDYMYLRYYSSSEHGAMGRVGAGFGGCSSVLITSVDAWH